MIFSAFNFSCSCRLIFPFTVFFLPFTVYSIVAYPFSWLMKVICPVVAAEFVMSVYLKSCLFSEVQFCYRIPKVFFKIYNLAVGHHHFFFCQQFLHPGWRGEMHTTT